MLTIEQLEALHEAAKGRHWNDAERIQFDIALRNAVPQILALMRSEARLREALEQIEEIDTDYTDGPDGNMERVRIIACKALDASDA